MQAVRVVFISKNPLSDQIQEIEIGCRTTSNGNLEVIRLRAHEQLHIGKMWGLKTEDEMRFIPNSIYIETIVDGVAISRYNTKRIYKGRGRKSKKQKAGV